jgi:hypothetical protein
MKTYVHFLCFSPLFLSMHVTLNRDRIQIHHLIHVFITSHHIIFCFCDYSTLLQIGPNKNNIRTEQNSYDGLLRCAIGAWR